MDQLFLHSVLDAEQFRSLSNQAVKRGNPRWFWPEVSIDEWRAVVSTMELVIRDVLLRGSSSTIIDERPEVVSVAAFTTGTGPLLGHWLQERRFAASETSTAVLLHHLAHNEKRMAKLAVHALKVVEELARRGIEATVLKGMHTAFAHFPRPATRPMSDIDILINPTDEPGAAAALRGLGFRCSGNQAFPERTWRMQDVPSWPRSLYFVHEDDQWSIDLHVSFDLKVAWAAPRVKVGPTSPPARPSWALSPEARALEQPVQLLHLAVHASANPLSLTLLRLTELVMVIRADTSAGILSWDDLLSAASRAGVLGALYPAFELCERLVPGTVPDSLRLACRERAPVAVSRLVNALTPSTANGMVRCSIAERFMWLPSKGAIARQILYDLLPLHRSVPEVLQIYRMLGWRMLKKTVTR